MFQAKRAVFLRPFRNWSYTPMWTLSATSSGCSTEPSERPGISLVQALSRLGARRSSAVAANSPACGGPSRGPRTSWPCAASTAAVASRSFGNTASIPTPPETTHFTWPPDGGMMFPVVHPQQGSRAAGLSLVKGLAFSRPR